jgi:hypothetical protein
MGFTVTWRPSAVHDASELWLAARQRRTIADAINRIDVLLAADPQRVGEEFYGDRLLVVPPIHVTYVVHLDDRRVDVEQIWQVGK